MRYPLILILATLPVAAPVAATAQGFEGAVGDLQFQMYDYGPSDLNSLEGTLDASWLFGGFGTQVGLVLGKAIDSSSDIDFDQYNGIALHGTVDVAQGFRLGAMMAADNRADEIYLYAAEALYIGGPVRVEGRIGDSLDDDQPFSLFEVKGDYAFPNAFSARANWHDSDYGTGSYEVFSLGAGYAFSDTGQLYADFGRHETETGATSESGNVISLGIRFDLGGDGERLFSYQPLN
jgi:predicted porin